MILQGGKLFKVLPIVVGRRRGPRGQPPEGRHSQPCRARRDERPELGGRRPDHDHGDPGAVVRPTREQRGTTGRHGPPPWAVLAVHTDLSAKCPPCRPAGTARDTAHAYTHRADTHQPAPSDGREWEPRAGGVGEEGTGGRDVLIPCRPKGPTEGPLPRLRHRNHQ